MKINKFDVIELNDRNKATILDIKENKYLVEVVDDKGNSLGHKVIKDNNINQIIFSKNN